MKSERALAEPFKPLLDPQLLLDSQVGQVEDLFSLPEMPFFHD